jgi:hypothetical protein
LQQIVSFLGYTGRAALCKQQPLDPVDVRRPFADQRAARTVRARKS